MRRVASRNPKAADPQYWLGIIAAREGNNTAIRRYFSKCLELCPEYSGALAHYYMGVVHYTDGDYETAVSALSRYFELADGSDDKDVLAVYDDASNYLHWSTFLAEAELNQAPYDPKRVRSVCSKHDETMPYLTLDGREYYFMRHVPDRQRITVYHSEIQLAHWQLYVSPADGAAGAGIELPQLHPAGTELSSGVSITADGNELYLSLVSHGNSDIYLSRRENGQWLPPEPLGPQVNSATAWDAQPTVSPDGSTLLFASIRSGGQGGIDIWRCHRLPNGDWSRAENLGPAVNTMGNEKCPFLAADGHTLYFLSDGWQGFGGFDVFFDDLGTSSRPINLGKPINTEADEESFGVSPDGYQAYTTGRLADSRSSDILDFELYPAARPEPMWLWRTQATDTAGRPLRATLKMHGRSTYRSVGDSLYVMLSELNDNVLTITSDGFMPCIFRLKAKDVVRRRVGEGVSLLPMAGDAEQHLDLSDSTVVNALALWLIDNPRVRIAVECPTKAEAERAYAILRLNGIRPDRMTRRGGTDIKQRQIRIL